MNEAGVSNMNYYWLKLQKEFIDSNQWLEYHFENGDVGILATIVFSLNYETALFYHLEDSDKYFRVDVSNESAGSADNLN